MLVLPPEFLQSTDSVVEKAAEQFDFASAERSAPVYIRVWSTFQLACTLTQGGDNIPNRVSYCQGSRQLPPLPQKKIGSRSIQQSVFI